MRSNHAVLSVLFLFREYQKFILSEVDELKRTRIDVNEMGKLADDLEKKIILLMRD